MHNNNKKNKLGFTLLELLVVISIIGILLALGAVAYSTAQRKSRDAKRRGDIKSLQNGFEQYYASNNASYGTCNAMLGDTNIFPGGAPVDPQTQATYPCSSSVAAYCVCAELESDEGNAEGNPCPQEGLPSVVESASNKNDFYCLSNLQ